MNKLTTIYILCDKYMLSVKRQPCDNPGCRCCRRPIPGNGLVEQQVNLAIGTISEMRRIANNLMTKPEYPITIVTDNVEHSIDLLHQRKRHFFIQKLTML